MNHEQRLLRHATRMAIVTFMSRLAGYVRDKALAWVLGAEALNDAFRTAFRIPNAFRALLAEGALHAAFVPALARLTDEGDSGREARELVRGLTAALLLETGVVVGLGIACSPWLVRLYAPGFVGDSATLEATVLMNRLMFPYLALVSLAALLQGVLNSRERFLLPAATPIALNDMRTGETQSIEVKPSYGLSDQEVERMIEDSFKFAADDVSARKLIAARLDAGALITTTEKSLADGGHLVATGEVEAIRTALSALSTAKDGNDPRAIRARMADIEQAAKGLTVAMLDDSLKQGLQGKKVSDVTQS